jgi:hypothetical protein
MLTSHRTTQQFRCPLGSQQTQETTVLTAASTPQVCPTQATRMSIECGHCQVCGKRGSPQSLVRSWGFRVSPEWAKRRANCKMRVHAGSGWLHGARALPGLLQGPMTGAQQLHIVADSYFNPEANMARLWSLPSAPLAPGAPAFQASKTSINHTCNMHHAGGIPFQHQPFRHAVALQAAHAG